MRNDRYYKNNCSWQLDTARKRNVYYGIKRSYSVRNGSLLQGCSGQSLDVLARTPLWEKGLDYNHGTGHGVGYLLSVHEGPNSFRYRPSVNGRNDCVFEEGMITSDEPGIYLEGKFGIRLENMIVCQKDMENDYGSFLCFDALTLVPFERSAIIAEELSTKEKNGSTNTIRKYLRQSLHILQKKKPAGSEKKHKNLICRMAKETPLLMPL